MTDFNSWLAAWQKRLKPAMQDFLETARLIGDGLSVWLVASTMTFARGGWSEVPLKDMGLTEASQLVDQLWDKSDEEIKRELDIAIPEYFRRNEHTALSDLVEDWRLHFKDRYQVLEDALWAHKHGRYTLSISTLAAQVEGIVRDLVEDYDSGSQWRRRFLEALGHDPMNPPVPTKPEELPEFMALPMHERFQGVEALSKYFTLVRIQELFEWKAFSDPQSWSAINRHVILHGVFRKYEESESLKMFFVLDLLHEAAGMYEETQLSNSDREIGCEFGG